MEKLITKLLGRPFLAPDDKSGANGGQGDGGKSEGGGSDGDAKAGGDDGGGAKGSSAADIRAKSGGAFSKSGNGKADAGKQGGASDDAGGEVENKAKGDRPDYIPEKFWDTKTKAANVEGLAKAYTTLEASFATLKGEKGFGKAGDKPEDYLKPDDWKIPEGKEWDRLRSIDVKTDPAVAIFRDVAHARKVPVDVAMGLALDFLRKLSDKAPVPKTEADIIADLGEGGEALRDELGTWLEGQFTSKMFSEDELDWAFNHFGGDAVGLRVLAKVREMTGEKPIPISIGKSGDDIPSVEEWYAMNADPRYTTEPAFREKVDKLAETIFGDEPSGSSEPGVGVPPQRKVERRERASTQA